VAGLPKRGPMAVRWSLVPRPGADEMMDFRMRNCH
jgi:hypothetical protein